MTVKILSADQDKPTEISDGFSVSEKTKTSFEKKRKKRKFDWKNKNHRAATYMGGSLIALIFVVWIVWFFFFQTHKENLTVERGTWERKIGVDSFEPRNRSGWTYPPSDAYDVNRDYRYHYSRDVFSHYEISTYDCGTYSEPRTCTRQKAVYRSEPVYDWFYSYTVDRWGFDKWIISSGEKTIEPYWPDLSSFTLSNKKEIGSQRLSGTREEDYDVYFRNESGEEKHLDISLDVWTNMVVGETYSAEVNRVGVIRSVNWKD